MAVGASSAGSTPLTGGPRSANQSAAQPNSCSLGEAVAHASRSGQLFPGELPAAGILPGGSGMELRRWLAPGDELRPEIDGIGVIDHRIQP